MGKGQKQLQQQATQRSEAQYQSGNAAQKRLVEGSPEFQARQQLIAARRGSINAGDLRKAKDFIGNEANTAAREEQRQVKSNLTKTGIGGLASNYADPTQIALAEKMNKDEFARDSAAQTEADAKEYIAQTEQMENNIINLRAGIDQGIMSTAWGSSNNNLQTAAQIAASRASILPSILGSVISGAASVAAGGNWFQKAGAAAGGGGGGGHR